MNIDDNKSFEDTAYEQLVSNGIMAAKDGRRADAISLLNKAAAYHKPDARPWMWLSATSDDPQKQREYLENAVAAEPSNAAARRGLVMLSDKLDKARLVPEGQAVQPLRPGEPQEAAAEAYMCPNCGGRLSFEIQKNGLVCESCGYVRTTDTRPAADSAEQTMDYVLPTTRSQRWAEAQHRLSCAQCGALILLPPGQKTTPCPYCGSNQLVESSEAIELVDPQVVGVMKVEAKQAASLAKKWLGQGLFVPDDLAKMTRRLQLRPAYYPFWTFDGTVEVDWRCEVNEGSSRNPNWAPRNGSEFQNFDDILIPGLQSMTPEMVAAVEPFKLKDVVEFKPDFLIGWQALSYNRTLADASLLAREKVITGLHRALNSRIEPGKEKRNINHGAGKWSGLTFKLALLPLWVGAYEYQGKLRQVLVNGQTGKVGGSKPSDRVKVIVIVIAALLLVLIIAALIYLWVISSGSSFTPGT
jgi:DNA-directed RNA polymerase subunit RPC12/RpoP